MVRLRRISWRRPATAGTVILSLTLLAPGGGSLVAALGPPAPVETCQGMVPTIVGTDGRDVLVGTDGPDVIAALGGDDVVRARAGDDIVCAGAGHDRVRAGAGADSVEGNGGRDSLFGGDGDDVLRGGAGTDGCLQGAGTGLKESCAVRLAAAGDIACDPRDSGWNDGKGTAAECRMAATGRLLRRRGLVAVLTLGDNQYDDGKLWKFRRSYGRTWGRVKNMTYPTVGNHEYGTPGAAGHFEYFGSVAGKRGWYSFELDDWHVIVLNSACAAVGGCHRWSPQGRWLARDLEAHAGECTLVSWHAPRFSSGLHGDHLAYDPFWRMLYRAGADVILNGHDHHYERFAPQRPDGSRDRVRGIRQFIVGTGGGVLYPVVTARPNSVIRRTHAFGVLRLRLEPGGYGWRFVSVGGQTLGSGTASCH